MKYLLGLILLLLNLSCANIKENKPFSSVEIEPVYEDTISIRAIEIMGNSLAFAANNGVFGTVDLSSGKVRSNVEKWDTITPEFRAVAHTSTDFFMLSTGNPALLYKTGDGGKMDLVYKEEAEGVFYDAMTFWNNMEGIAVGDGMNGCLSIILTNDGGLSWKKLPCSELPQGIDGEGAFAASNTNIKTVGNHTWIATTASRIYYSGDKGNSWVVYDTPVINGSNSEGIYSIDFYDDQIGMAIGGDYTLPDNSLANKAITQDGGKSWHLIADGQMPSYKSCVQFVPHAGGNGIIALGFTGITYSSDRGISWKQLSEESFYTLRFLNDSTAYAAGKNKISKLTFR